MDVLTSDPAAREGQSGCKRRKGSGDRSAHKFRSITNQATFQDFADLASGRLGSGVRGLLHMLDPHPSDLDASGGVAASRRSKSGSIWARVIADGVSMPSAFSTVRCGICQGTWGRE